MIRILSDNNQQLQLLASETIYNLAKFRRARRSVRKHGGIPKLVDLLDVDLDSVSRIYVYIRDLRYNSYINKRPHTERRVTFGVGRYVV